MEPEIKNYGNDRSSIDKNQEETNINLGATVKLYNPQSGKCLASLKSDLHKTVGEMKDMLATELKVSVDCIICEFQDGTKSDSTLLKDIENCGQDDLKFTLRITAEDEPIQGKEAYKLPDVIKVKIPLESATSPRWRYVYVAIVKDPSSQMKKAFLGGYRNTKSGAIYHHAIMQTLPKGCSPHELEVAANKRSRDTQTCQLKTEKIQTSCNTSTQMTKPGLYVSEIHDRRITPRSYETSDEVMERKVEKVVILQKHFRRWLAKNRVDGLRMERMKRLEWEMNELRREEEEKEREKARDKERRIHPTTKQDFDLLFDSLRKWKKEEIESINKILSGAERKAALCMLLDRESELIAILSRLQKQASEENREHGIMKFLNQASAPKTWKRSSDGKDVSMNTPETLRASLLKQIYITLKTRFEAPEERLDALLVLKNTIQEYDNKLSHELLDLIDRETTLILRGVNEDHLQGLRSRIVTLFVQLTKDPVFNPQAAKWLKLPSNIRTLEQQYKKLMNRNSSPADTNNMLEMNQGAVASSLTKHEDLSAYRSILDDVIGSELEMGNGFSVAYIMQEKDMRHLFENIWEGQSALSFCDDPKELVFVRWIMEEPWSPWNCILLLRKEAQAHKKVDDVLKVYGDEFLHKVNSKHTMAQSYLSHLQLLIISQFNNNIKRRAANNKIKGENKPANVALESTA